MSVQENRHEVRADHATPCARTSSTASAGGARHNRAEAVASRSVNGIIRFENPASNSPRETSNAAPRAPDPLARAHAARSYPPDQGGSGRSPYEPSRDLSKMRAGRLTAP